MLAILTSFSDLVLQNLVWILVGLLMIILLIRALYEPTCLEITHQVLKSHHGCDALAGTTDHLRVALLSDLHAEWLRLKPAQIALALSDEEIDCLLFAGDLTGRHHPPELASPWLSAISDVCRQRQIPCFAVPGNHDSQASLKLLEKAGFTLLINESAILHSNSGQNWLLLGLDVMKKGQPDFIQTLRESSADGQAIPVTRRLVLAHNPDTLFLIPPGQAEFFLAGHFHGGQIYLPFHLEFFFLRREKLGRMGYHRGSFGLNDLTGYISRGLGSVLFPLRLGSIPELPVLDMIACTQDHPDQTSLLQDTFSHPEGYKT